MSRRNPERLGQRQQDAIVALLNNQSVQKAADQVGVSYRTIFRWLEQPEFAEAYRRARRETFAQAIAQTQRYAALAVNTLAKVMLDAAAPTNAKVSAAIAVLRFGREGIELEDVEARVAALERAASAQGAARLVA